MNAMKWSGPLFVLISILLVIRIAVWIFPPAEQNAEPATEAVEASVEEEGMAELIESPSSDATEIESQGEPVPDVEPPAEAEVEPVWQEEADRDSDWPPAPEDELDLPLPPLSELPPAPEEFHLRKTRWGMPLEEVRASEPEAPLRESESAVLYLTTTLEMPCLLMYSFRQGRLVRARLSFSDPTGQLIPPLSVAQAQRRFLFLREQLNARYGEPILQETHVPRNVSGHQRSLLKQEELSAQYDQEIQEDQLRLNKQREVLQTRFEHWSNKAERIARGLAPIERDIRELKQWKKVALEQAAESRQNIEVNRKADAENPLIATMAARWAFAKERHDVELMLDVRSSSPRLDIRYKGRPVLPAPGAMDEL